MKILVRAMRLKGLLAAVVGLATLMIWADLSGIRWPPTLVMLAGALSSG